MTANAWRPGDRKGRKFLHYPECGLDDVYLANGYEVVNTPYGEGLTIRDLDDLHRAIGVCLATGKKALNGRELRFLRRHMNWTQAEAARYLRMSAQQVARWEKGQCDIPGPAESLLRALYLEHVIGDQLPLRELLEELLSLSAPVPGKHVFEETAEGWRALAA